MKSLSLTALAAFALLAACNTAEAPKQPAGADPMAGTLAPPAGTDWATTVVKTPEGGMKMGNPNAPVKLIEYGALSCSHCAEFAETSKEGLKALVAKGTVSYEFRNFLLNVLDVPAALAARCNGPATFFPIAEQMFEAQHDWLGKTQSITAEEQKSWGSLKPEQLAPLLASKLGLDVFAQQRGVGAEKLQACLADKAAIDELANMSKVAQEKYKVTGTPTFFINEQLAPNAGTWQALEPQLKAAGA